MPPSASKTTRCAALTVSSAWSYAGATSTTSTPTTSCSRQSCRTNRNRSAVVMPPGSGVPVPGACAGSSTSMSTETYSFSALARASLHRVAHDFFEAALPDLLHGVPRHALFLHPLEGVLWRPVAAESHLNEMATRHGTGLD